MKLGCCVFFLLSVYLLVEADDDQMGEIQREIVQLMNDNHDLTVIEQSKKVKELLSKLDLQTRTKYESWMDQLRDIEKDRVDQLKNLLLKLSPEAQQAFSRILMVQQSETLSAAEKSKRLETIGQDLPDAVKKEIADQLKRQETLKKFMQSRSY